jgi:hypothetical protein
VADSAPKNPMGLTGGIFNFVTHIAGIVTPLLGDIKPIELAYLQ